MRRHPVLSFKQDPGLPGFLRIWGDIFRTGGSPERRSRPRELSRMKVLGRGIKQVLRAPELSRMKVLRMEGGRMQPPE
jgi:hypothetical protein